MYINDGQIAIVVNKLYERHFFFEDNLRFREETYFEDIQIMPRILNKASKMVITNVVLYFYRQRIGSTTKTKQFNHRRLDIISVIEDRMEFFASLNKKHLYYIEVEGYLRKLIRYRNKMRKYDYKDENDIREIEGKLSKTFWKFAFNPNVSIKIKVKSLISIVKNKICR